MVETEKTVVRKRGRRGVAILLTLAIMSLLLILAMGFLFNSSTGKLSASVNADIIRARMLTDSGLQRFIAMIERDVSTQAGSQFYAANSFYSPTVGDWAGRRYVASVGDGDFANGSDSPLYAVVGRKAVAGGYIEFTPGALDADLASWVRWVNVSAPVATSDGSAMGTWSDSRVIGRFAFLAVDETGKIDPGAVLRARTAEAAYTDSGHDFREVYLANTFVTTNPTVDEFRRKATFVDDDGNGILGDNDLVVWDSWEHMVRSGINNLNSGPSEALQALFPHSHELEAFCELTDSAVTRHRFNLRRDLAADGETVATLTSGASLFEDPNTGGIHLLSGGTLSATQRQTIAANILDYTDSDNKSTTDNLSNPTYMGNEAVPYINELVFEVVHELANSVSRVTISLWPEYVNIYPNDFASANGRLYVEVTFTCGEGGGVINLSKDYAASDVFDAQSYTAASLGGSAVASGSHDFAVDNTDLTNFAITGVRSWFFKHNGTAGFSILDAELWDAAILPGSDGSVTISQNDGVLEYNQRICFEVNDPRYNLDASQWGANAWSDSTAATDGATMGDKNIRCDEPGAGAANDDEVAGYMTGTTAGSILISTAHIANKPFDSLWELGCIHRAAPWQTINLGKFNGSLLSGSYDEGDSQILDQVKLSDETVVRGKLNANSRYPLAWRALIGHVKIGGSYDDIGGTLVDITPWSSGTPGFDLVGDPAALVASGPSIIERQITDRGWYNRGQIANVPNIKNDTLSGTAPATDAAQEEIIGKLANQLSTRSNWFSVIICAQALNPFKNDLVLAEHKVLAVIYRDVFTGETRVEQMMPLED